MPQPRFPDKTGTKPGHTPHRDSRPSSLPNRRRSCRSSHPVDPVKPVRLPSPRLRASYACSPTKTNPISGRSPSVRQPRLAEPPPHILARCKTQNPRRHRPHHNHPGRRHCHMMGTSVPQGVDRRLLLQFTFFPLPVNPTQLPPHKTANHNGLETMLESHQRYRNHHRGRMRGTLFRYTELHPARSRAIYLAP